MRASAADLSSVRPVVLDNGLTLLVREIHTAPLASVWCWYKVGSRDEPTGCAGVSHWVDVIIYPDTLSSKSFEEIFYFLNIKQ
jgi:zinc protease